MSLIKEPPPEEIEEYGDPEIRSADARIPLWLKMTYIILPLWGIVALIVYWNGSTQWFERDYWHLLQQASNTTNRTVNK